MEDIHKKELLYEGKAKILYKTNKPGFIIQYFKDDTTAFNKLKFEKFEGKGEVNNEISALLLKKLEGVLPHHFVKKLNEREQLILAAEIIPLEVVVRNTIAGSFAKNFGLESGRKLPSPLVEFFFKKDELNDPFISPNQILALEIATGEDIRKIEEYALKVNSVLLPLFKECGIKLVDFKLEFGRNQEGEIILADEVSPDTCRLWDERTLKPLDKDIFRKDLGNMLEAYKEVLKRLSAL